LVTGKRLASSTKRCSGLSVGEVSLTGSTCTFNAQFTGRLTGSSGMSTLPSKWAVNVVIPFESSCPTKLKRAGKRAYGTALGTRVTWSVSGIALQPGTNVLTVTAFDQAGNSGSLTVIYQALVVLPPMNTLVAQGRLADGSFQLAFYRALLPQG
jgi:hypothetical protein